MIKLFTSLYFYSTLLLACSSVKLLGKTSEPSRIYLGKELGSTYVSARVERDRVVAKYCPDNTCDVISAPSNISVEVVDDFSLIYLARYSSYGLLRQFQKSISDKEIDSRTYKYQPLCVDDIKTTTCVLNGMRTRFNIKIFFSRADEGKEIFVEKTN